MQLFLRRSALLVGVILILCGHVSAQGGIELNMGGSSQFCPMPATINLVYNQPYSASPPCLNLDTVFMTLYWGDGTDTSFYEIFPLTYCYFSGMVSHTYATPGEFSPMLVASYPDSTLDTASLTFSVSPDCITFEGMAYLDANENCSFDGPDHIKYNLPIKFIDTNNVTYLGFCDSNGHFEVSIPEGIGPIRHLSELGALHRICPDTGIVIFSSNNDSTFNLGYICEPNTTNQVLTMHGPRIGAPGNLGGVDMTIFNTSCGNIVKQVQLTWEPLLTYEDCYACSTLPDSIVNNTAYWNPEFGVGIGQSITKVNQFFTGRLLFRTDTLAYMNQPTTMSASVHYTNDETDSVDNFKERTRYVGVPIDPNNKEVDPQGVGPTGRILPGTRLTYTINFQNTGSAPARHVKILDTLPEVLDPSTIRILGSLHYMKTSYYKGGVLRFDFPDINLPDSTANEPESHGWLTFEISPKDVPLGTVIENRVGIYFDYQAPVITNYTLNTIDTFPYPLLASITSEPMTCSSDENGAASVDVTQGNGQYTFLWNTGATAPEINGLESGTYTVTITDRADSVLILTTYVEHTPIHPNPTVGAFDVPTQVGAWQPYIHQVEYQPNQLYEWDALVGDVLESAGNSVKVLWHAGPVGTLIVTQINEFGCKASDSTNVPILFVGTEELGENPLVVFPNPTKDRLYIQGIPAGTTVEINVIDLQGRSVARTSTSSDSPWIKVGSLAPGNYQMQVQKDAEHVGSFPFVKE